jgi:hypothetical protein
MHGKEVQVLGQHVIDVPAEMICNMKYLLMYSIFYLDMHMLALIPDKSINSI